LSLLVFTERSGVKIQCSDLLGDLFSYRGPLFTENFRLLQNGLSCFFLFVGWIAVFAQNPFYDYAYLGAGVFANSPVYAYAPPDCFNQFVRNRLQRFIPQNLHRTVVNLKRIVEGDFITINWDAR
jgi:hypothetical protein